VFDALLQVVPSTGTYPLRLSLSHVRGRPREEIALPAASAAVVVEGRADQVFELSIDADALAAAIVEFNRTGR
jgi:hypothetical protein